MNITCLASTTEGNTYYFDVPPSKWKLPPGFMIKMARYPGEEAEVVAFNSIPDKTPEEIAAELREKDAINLFATINWNDGESGWFRMSESRKDDYRKAIDAGYRKFEIVEEDV